MPEVRYDHSLESEERHEHRDIRVSMVLKIGIGFVAAAGVILVGLWLLYKLFASVDENVGRAPAAEFRRVPPPPRLQVAPEQDLRQLRAGEEAALNTYGWADRRSGVVRIPIDRAMDLVVERGLPVRPEDGGSQEGRGSRIEDRGSPESRGSRIEDRGSPKKEETRP